MTNINNLILKNYSIRVKRFVEGMNTDSWPLINGFKAWDGIRIDPSSIMNTSSIPFLWKLFGNAKVLVLRDNQDPHIYTVHFPKEWNFAATNGYPYYLLNFNQGYVAQVKRGRTIREDVLSLEDESYVRNVMINRW